MAISSWVVSQLWILLVLQLWNLLVTVDYQHFLPFNFVCRTADGSGTHTLHEHVHGHAAHYKIYAFL